MKIGFDVSQTCRERAGCGYFADQLIRNLIEIDRENNYLLYPVFYDYRHPDFKKSTSISAQNVTSMYQNMSWQSLEKLWNETDKKDELLGSPDIIHSNNYSCPKDVTAKVIVTIYDLSYLDCPEFTTNRIRTICFNGAFESSIYADHIITISEFSKKRFLYYFPHYPEEKISVIYPGARTSIKKSDKNAGLNFLKKFKINRHQEYFLSVGTIEPRKNHSLLLEVYSELYKKYKDIFPLYIAGGKGWLYDSIYEKTRKLGIEGKVRFTGYVKDEELSSLYSNCYAFIFPSFYEGFGLPVLEAMAWGAPVITSNRASIPEVCGDAALLIDPDSCESLYNGMERILKDRALKDELSGKAVERARIFSWRKTAEELLNVYRRVIKE